MSRFQTAFDKISQILLPILTISGQFLVANKMPKMGFAITVVSQIFWMYTSYQSYRKAGQVGIFITTIIMTGVHIYGLINWWFLK